jgi:hypothetical protein
MKKNLSLNKETLRRLNLAPLGKRVVGGVTLENTDCLPCLISDSCPNIASCDSCACSAAECT